MSLCHQSFLLDRVYGAEDSNDTFCREEVAPLVARAEAGLDSTLLFFGQVKIGTKKNPPSAKFRLLTSAISPRATDGHRQDVLAARESGIPLQPPAEPESAGVLL